MDGSSISFQTAVACLFNLSLEEVPHFISYKSEWWDKLQEWLGERGLECNIGTYPYGIRKNKFYIVSGDGGRGHSHSVIYKGKTPYHDPHPDNTFLVGEPKTYYIFSKINKTTALADSGV